MIQLTDATFIVNDEPIPVMPDSVAFTEGLGEQTMRAASVGGGEIEAIYSNDLSTAFSMVRADMPSVIELIELAKTWKLNQNSNVVQIIGKNADGTITRTFSRAALITDYEIALGADASVTIEFRALPTT